MGSCTIGLDLLPINFGCFWLGQRAYCLILNDLHIFSGQKTMRILRNCTQSHAEWTHVRARGFSRLEMFVSTLLFLIGLIGFVLVQTRFASRSSDSEDRVQAIYLADWVVRRILLQHSSVLPSALITTWEKKVSSSLPNGVGVIVPSLNGATVSITWQSADRGQSEDSNRLSIWVGL